MSQTIWLIDKSALVRLGTNPDAAEWRSRIERGLVRIAPVTLLEVGFSARSSTDLSLMRARPPVSAMPIAYSTQAIEDRALEVQSRLAQRGLHRAASVPDLLVAATAELSGLTMLHQDKDFPLIAEVTGQPVEWLLRP